MLWLGLLWGRGSFVPLVLLLIGVASMAVRGIWPGFALGVFIGLGVSLLLIGACFAAF
jgi:hypothetical protein